MYTNKTKYIDFSYKQTFKQKMNVVAILAHLPLTIGHLAIGLLVFSNKTNWLPMTLEGYHFEIDMIG